MSGIRKFSMLCLAALVCAIPTLPGGAAEPKKCTFTTTNTENPGTVIAVDTDADNFCEWPDGSRSLRGTLTFPAGTLLEFRANTSITADRIVVEQAAVLAGISSRLHDLTLRAREGFQGSGEINVRAEDDLIVTSDEGDVNLFGPTRLDAGDSVLVQARRGSLRIAPPDIDSIDVGAFTLRGCNDVYVRANGADGKIIVNRSRLGGRRVRFDTKANLSVVQNKSLTVLDSVITTRTADTGCPTGNYVSFRGDADISVGNTKVRAATNILFNTGHPTDDVCLADGTHLEAKDGFGDIDLRAVRGRNLIKYPGEAPDLVGRVRGNSFELEDCAIPQ